MLKITPESRAKRTGKGVSKLLRRVPRVIGAADGGLLQMVVVRVVLCPHPVLRDEGVIFL